MDKKAGVWVKLTSLKLEPGDLQQVWLRSVDQAVTVCKEVYINADDAVAEQYLVSTDSQLNYQQLITLYQKRWNVESYHKSLKQNTQATESPTRTETTQNNHLFCSLLAYVKLERLRITKKINHFALKSRLYLNAVKAAFSELASLKQSLPTLA